MSEEKKTEPGTGAPATDNSNLIADPKSPNDDNNQTGGGDKSGFKGTPTDEDKKGSKESKSEESKLQKSYEELESKLGKQGEELGDYRNFFKEISPLLDKLDEQPELVQAIIDGKVDTSLAKAASEGKISIQDAEAVTEAHKEVKKEVGEKKYKELSPEEIEQKIAGKVNELKETLTKDVKKKSDEMEKMRDYKTSLDTFIKETKDFPEYADDIYKWLDEHPDQDDIKIAYNVVKGIALQKKSEEESDEEKGEAAKAIASNAAGGGSQGGTVTDNKDIADELIGGKSNPNTF